MANNNNSDVMESLDAAEYVVQNAKHVHIHDENFKSMLKQMVCYTEDNEEEFFSITSVFYRPETYPDINDSKVVDWLFVFHTLNFSLFNSKGTKQWRAGNTEGYFALCFAIKRAIDEGKPLWDPKYYITLTQNELQHIFRSDDGETRIPLISKRLIILHKVGKVLLNKYQGTFVECIKSSGYNADKLVKLLFDEFASYRDEAFYNSKKIRLHTKANSLVSDVWACFKKQFHLDTKNLMSTMLIDYRTPIVLLHWKILCYSKQLEERFKKSNKPLEHGSMEEIEIRSCSLVAIKKMSEFMYAFLRNNMPNINKNVNIRILMDNFMTGFVEAKIDKCLNQETFHYIRSVYY